MAEKTEKTEKTEKKTPARAGRATKAPPKVAARAIKAPAKAAGAARSMGARIGTEGVIAAGAGVDVLKQHDLLALTGEVRFHPVFTEQATVTQSSNGLVSSAKQPHTVTVVVERMREHPLYKKVVRLRKKYAAHAAAGDVRAGDLVRIQESRPFSATKRWRVVEVISRAGEAGAAAPRVADVEKMLEAAEGSGELLVREREEPLGGAAPQAPEEPEEK